MDNRTLLPADIDKVRGRDGFPIGSDVEISSMSVAPYYTGYCCAA